MRAAIVEPTRGFFVERLFSLLARAMDEVDMVLQGGTHHMRGHDCTCMHVCLGEESLQGTDFPMESSSKEGKPFVGKDEHAAQNSAPHTGHY